MTILWRELAHSDRECLEMPRAIYGQNENHPVIAAALNNLGDICVLLGKLDDPETIQRACLNMERAIYGDYVDDSDLANIWFNFSTLLLECKKVEEGL